MEPDAVLGLAALAVILIGGLALFVFWILMLINAAKREKWGWFVAQLIFGVLVSVIYRLADYEPYVRDFRGRHHSRRSRSGGGRNARRGGSAPRRRRRR